MTASTIRLRRWLAGLALLLALTATSAVAQDFDEVDGCKAYLAGPPVMVEAATLLLEQRGLSRMDIHADAFYTAAEMASAGKKTGAEQ